MAGISSLGVGTGGLDTALLLEKIKAGEQLRLVPYTNLQNSYKAKVSAWGLISNGLSALHDPVKALNGDGFNTLTVSNNNAFSATATSQARADTHVVRVDQLATAHKIKTAPQESQFDQLGEANGSIRTLKISHEDGSVMSIELKDDETSIDQIAKAINRADGDVTASVQRTDDGYQLVLSSKTTGEDGKMTVSVEGDSKLNEVLNSKEMEQVSAAQNAKLRVDGSSYTRSSNTISDIIDGVTLNLKDVTPADKPNGEQLTLSKDNSAIKTNVQEFVKQYNALNSIITAKSKYVPFNFAGLKDEEVATTNAETGALMGDSTLRGLNSELRAAVNGVYGNSGSDYTSLADIGISIDPATGEMTLDEKKLDAAIADSPDDIAAMFMGRGEAPGVANSLDEIITKYVGDSDKKIDGIIKGSVDGLNSQVEQMQEQIDRTQRLIDAQVEIYRMQFQKLDTAMSKLNSMSQQLSAILQTL
ncbi:flagellar filament capping protein FliD (plasmid) [Enterobacter asburiae]|uniref:flagellar filament capping protein FliD n=1 Tax=Enterobacter asburiae TaxID=61645 RepID=UPI002932E35C|nr:flagellar filament capping protein FliD [Enterobacter asburiae]EMA4739825.1 flagellar filament capping protein FliD [Enterobacter asburiae]